MQEATFRTQRFDNKKKGVSKKFENAKAVLYLEFLKSNFI